MLRLLLDLSLAPALVAASTLAARRWNSTIGGLVSAFPAVVGPVLLITAQQTGAASAERAAKGTLLGLVALSGFVVFYGRLAPRAGWGPSLAAGWAAAGVLGVAAGAGILWATVVACGSLLAARCVLPACADVRHAPVTGSAAAVARVDIPLRMCVTAVLVALLAVAARLLGPLAGGILAALPVLASVLVVFVHRDGGAGAVIPFLRGMTTGMLGFAAFCAVVAVLVVPAGTVPAFAAALVVAVGVQAIGIHKPASFGGSERL